jgi:hypothetical protein
MRLAIACCLAAALTACTGLQKAGRAAVPRGPRQRLIAHEDRTPARLVLEFDPRRKPVGPATLHTFTFTIEERVGTPEEGRAPVSVRFSEVVGASGEPQLSDRLALALDDLKLSFWRGLRGEASELKIAGLRAPLDEPTVRAIAFALFSMGHGPRLPDRSVGLLDDWTVEAETEIVGLTAHQRYFYTLVSENGPLLEIREKGHVEGVATISGARRKLDGDTFSKETLDLDRGVVVGGEYEWTSVVDEEPPAGKDVAGVGHLRIRAERGRVVQRTERP